MCVDAVADFNFTADLRMNCGVLAFSYNSYIYGFAFYSRH